MKTKNNSRKKSNLLILVPVLLLMLLTFFSCSTKKKTSSSATPSTELPAPPPPPPPPLPPAPQDEDIPFVIVEEMPEYPGGDGALLEFIARSVEYPVVARNAGTQGRVITRFCVTHEGTVDRVSVLRGVDPELDKEAIRVISALTGFKPGRQGGKPVPVWYMVPIDFTLK